MSYRILLLGGGSGGHVYPLMAVADALKKKSSQSGVSLELLVMGEGKFLKESCSERGLRFKFVVAGKMRRYFSILNFLDLFKIPIGFLQSVWYIFWFMPDVVFAKGGYASLAGAIVSKLYLTPLFIHESDSTLGLANKVLSKMAGTIFTSFSSTEKYFKPGQAVLVGNPVRKNLLFGEKTTALANFGLSQEQKTILVLGGSQGAQRINRAILDSIVVMAKDFQVIHQCGESQYQAVKLETEKITKEGAGEYEQIIKNNYKFFPFFDEKTMALAYTASDVIISRAGAGSIFEIAAVGKPAIVIPLSNSVSRGDQIANALEFVKFGAVMIEEENLTTNILLNQIKSLLEPANLELTVQKIKSFATPDAADKIALNLLSK